MNSEYYYNNYLNGFIPVMERFVYIQGTNREYMIGDCGSVISLKGPEPTKKVPDMTKEGYYAVRMYTNGKARKELIHRLVAKHFVPNPNPSEYTIVNHRDSNRANNYFMNLQWCTPAFNSQYSQIFGNGCKAGNHPAALVSDEQALEIYNYSYNNPHLTDRQVGEVFGVDRGLVQRIRVGRAYNSVPNHRKIPIMSCLDGSIPLKAKQNPLPKSCGENNKSSKLKEHQVREIRRLCKETNMTDYDIAKLFDVHAKTIYDIRRYKIWKHVVD